ncbi:MAG: hypothetical protein R3C61_27205 [Bacteroidia bacterium]
MWEKIEKYINDHREEIDIDMPRDNMWSQIEKKLDRKNTSAKRRNMFDSPVWKVAAVVLMLFGIGYIWGSLVADPQRPNPYTTSLLNGIQRVETGFPELKDVDAHFAKELQQRMEIIETYNLKRYPFADDYIIRLRKLDEKINSQKEQLKRNGLDNQAAQGLVESYQHGELLDNTSALEAAR